MICGLVEAELNNYLQALERAIFTGYSSLIILNIYLDTFERSNLLFIFIIGIIQYVTKSRFC